jgi:hypothetical protein
MKINDSTGYKEYYFFCPVENHDICRSNQKRNFNHT